MKRNWVVGIVLTLISILALSSVAYALVQRAEAQRQAEHVLQLTEKNVLINRKNQELEIQLAQSRKVAEEQMKIAEALLRDLSRTK